MRQQPDRWFTAEQQRVTNLMEHWRLAGDVGRSLPPDAQNELEALASAEIEGARRRAEALLGAARKGLSSLPNYPSLRPVPAPPDEAAIDLSVLADNLLFVCSIYGPPLLIFSFLFFVVFFRA